MKQKKAAYVNKGGFTLPELLIVMAIVGILSSIALPLYSSYRARAFDVRAQSDLRSIALAEEAYYLDYERYLPCNGSTCTALPGIKKLSPGVTLSVKTEDATLNFTGESFHSKGTGKRFIWQDGLMITQ
jgi:type IV pilus assembly protein PilA